jgi:CheY-like chemotaxis protein
MLADLGRLIRGGERFRRADPQIDLVLTDVLMPHMTGTELAARIANGMPDLALLRSPGSGSHSTKSQYNELAGMRPR